MQVGMGCSPEWLCEDISLLFAALGIALVVALVWQIWRERHKR